MSWLIIVLSSADAARAGEGPANTTGCQHHLGKWLQKPYLLQRKVGLRAFTSRTSKPRKQSKSNSTTYPNPILTLTLIQALNLSHNPNPNPKSGVQGMICAGTQSLTTYFSVSIVFTHFTSHSGYAELVA